MTNLFPSKDKKALLMTLLKVMGGNRVVVGFSGGGDSGSVESVELLDHNDRNIPLDNAEFEWEVETSTPNEATGEWVAKFEVKPYAVAEILKDACEAALENANLDWYNNDGGQGSLEIDLSTEPPTITLNIGINTMTTEEYKFDYTEEEETEENNAPASS